MIELFSPHDAMVEGDRAGWHIRRRRKCGEIESWQLWHGETPQSSLFTKDQVWRWAVENAADGTVPCGLGPSFDVMS